MSGFSTEWLALREPHDQAARNAEAKSRALALAGLRETAHIVDLGGGTGSTCRALAPHLPPSARWTIIDNDPALLREAARQLPGSVRLVEADLGAGAEYLDDESITLVTASALLDLVSRDWLTALAKRLAERQLPFYAALNHSGRHVCTPPHPYDSKVFGAFHRHQNTDKGFGPALGSQAPDVAETVFRNLGYEVFSGPSDWQAGTQAHAFQRMLIEGWHEAACEIAPRDKAEHDLWLTWRLEAVRENRSLVMVGHQDIVAWESAS